MTSTQRYRLETALSALNIEVDKGFEFPEALCRTLKAYAVKSSDLIAAYDSQF